VAVSARTGAGLEALLEAADAVLADSLVVLDVLVPYDRYDLVTKVHEQGTIELKTDSPEGVRLRALVPRALAERITAAVGGHGGTPQP
jgi:GTP-binding protein HflX